MNSTCKKCLAATAGAVAIAFWSSPSLAQEEATPETELETSPRRNADFVDLTANLGYSTNPFLEFGDSTGSAYGRVSARGVHAWGGERSQSNIAAFVEASTYLNDYGLKSIFSVTGDTQHQASERVTVFGSAGVSGDIAGQLSNRFLYVPPIVEVPDPSVPPPPTTVEDPDLFSFTGRQYRIYGQGGASVRTSERGSLTVSGGAQRYFYTSDLLDDFTTIFGSGSYSHSLSERTTVGFSLGASRTNYDNSSASSTIIDPALTIRTRLSELWDASASVGLSFSRVEHELGGNDNATNISFDGTLCRTTKGERLCAHASRYAQNSSRAAVVTTTSVGVDWFKKLDEDQTIQLSAGLTRYISDFELVNDFKTHHARFAGSYSRRVNRRFSVGADVGVRALRQDGPDPDTDVGGSLFVRYRLGDIG